MRILLVDDDLIFLDITGRLLTRAGHVVTTGPIRTLLYRCSDRLPRRAPFEVILSDWQMPVVSGIEFCQAVRSEFGQKVYFILLTGLGDSVRLEGLEAGADDFLAKPFEASDLHGSLRAAELIMTPQAQRKPEPRRRAV